MTSTPDLRSAQNSTMSSTLADGGASPLSRATASLHRRFKRQTLLVSFGKGGTSALVRFCQDLGGYKSPALRSGE
jgi:hypothetical protein